MGTLGTTYRQAFEKQAFIGGLAKGVGKFMGSIPFWIAGSLAAEKLIGKKPKIMRRYVPRRQYQELLRQQQMTTQGGGY